MALDYVEDIAAYYRRIVDDPDESFLDTEAITVHLGRGESEFRQFVSNVDPMVFRASVSITPSNGEYDLGLGAPNPVKIMNAPPMLPANQPRLSRINMISIGTGSSRRRIPPARSWEEFENYSGGRFMDTSPRWILDGTILRFSGSFSGTVNIDYVPVSAVDWSAGQVVGSHVWVSEIPEFNDIIALSAAVQYQIEIGRDDPRILGQLAARQKLLRRFLTDGRIGGGVQIPFVY